MSFWEKLRKPCSLRGGAKQISVDAVIPLFAIPTLAVIAAQAFLWTLFIFLATPILVYYLHHNFLRFLLRTKFFLMWTITSVLFLMIIFEVSVVPLLEILPEENLIFIVCVVGGIWCGYETKLKADCGTQESALIQGLELGEGSGELCTTCRRRAPSRAYHCRLCQTCILNREYHCRWLDCCIGSSNLRWYLFCLFFSAFAFIYGSNLTMTSVCHPFILIGTILLPDDCSDVYYELDIALCFVSSLYSLLVAESPYDHEMVKNVSRLFCCKT
ncbi:palmitoyltransferase ZDHHC23-B isoform X2 [Prorops nasuta]|uniref:palmitoyltransferase ZDHHC23-B isoform X2 n=1 Tax=Prorops nasuta TaxID=863751 RepID=UPI0034CEC615